MPPRRPPSPSAASSRAAAGGTPAARAAAAKKTAAAAPKKAAASKRAAPAKKAAAKAAVKKAVAKSPVAKQAVARKTAAKKAVAKRVVAKKTAARKVAAKATRPARAKVARKPAARTTATRSIGLPKPATKRGASRAPASRPATSNRPRAGAGGRSLGPGSRVRTGMGRPVWVLAAIGVVLALLVLPYVQKWMQQRSDIAQVQAENEKTRREVAALETERRRWDDDEYVKAEARKRLFYVMPGETGFVVVDGQPGKAPTADPARDAAAKVKNGDRPWFDDLWSSVQAAGGER